MAEEVIILGELSRAENVVLWLQQVRMMLIRKKLKYAFDNNNLLREILDKEKKFSGKKTTTGEQDLLKQNAEIIKEIQSRLSGNLLERLGSMYETGFELFQDVKTFFKTDDPMFYNFSAKIDQIKQEPNESITDLYERFMTWVNCDTAGKRSDTELVFKFKEKVHQDIQDQIRNRFVTDEERKHLFGSDLQTFVKTLVNIEENLNRNQKKPSVAMTLNHTQWVEKDLRNQCRRRECTSGKPHEYKDCPISRERKCYECGKTGHTKRQCRQKPKLNLVESKEKQDDLDNIISTLKSLFGNKENVQSSSYYLSSVISQGSPTTRKFIIDSGASAHVTYDSGSLRNLQRETCREFILPNGDTLVSTGKGSLDVGVIMKDGSQGFVTLNDVYLIPEVKKSLLSVSKLQAEFEVMFKNGQCFIKRNSTNEECQLGQLMKDGLYYTKILSEEMNTFVPSSDILWHYRLGHRSFNAVKKTLEEAKISTSGMKEEEYFKCVSCHTCKSTAVSPNSDARYEAEKPLERIFLDCTGPLNSQSLEGHKLFLVIVDEASRYTWTFPMISTKEVKFVFERWLKMIEAQTEFKVKRVRSDNGVEFTNSEFQSILEKHQINHERSNAYHPFQNGKAERKIRHLKETVRTMLHQSKLPNSLWTYALRQATHLINNTYLEVVKSIPSQSMFGKIDDLKYYKVFGCLSYVHQDESIGFQDRARLGIYLGVSDNRHGYKVYFPADGKYVETIHCRFDESKFIKLPTGYMFAPENTRGGTNQYGGNFRFEFHTDSLHSDLEVMFDEDQQKPNELEVEAGRITDVTHEESHKESTQQEKEEQEVENVVPVEEEHVQTEKVDEVRESDTLKRSARIAKKKRKREDELENEERKKKERLAVIQRILNLLETNKDMSKTKEEFGTIMNLELVKESGLKNEIKVPSSFGSAMKSELKGIWKTAMDEEIRKFMNMGAFELVRLPTGQKIVPSRWHYTLKRDKNNVLVKAKARFIAKGYVQNEDELDVTYAPTLHPETLRLVLMLAATNDMEIEQYDVSNAFLHAEIDEEVYVAPPEGYQENDKYGNKMVWKMRKAIYGLKQSPRLWNNLVNEKLKKFGFVKSEYDHCCYYLNRENQDVIVIHHVDDFLVVGHEGDVLKSVKTYLKGSFEIKEMGPTDTFLNIHLRRDRKNKTIYLSQEHYAREVLKRFKFEDAKPLSTPLPCEVIKPFDEEEGQYHCNYMEILGSLNYLANFTRPDIQYTVSKLSEYMMKHNRHHYRLLTNVLRYLQGTMELSLKLNSGETKELVISAYSDADFAGDSSDSKSRTGSVVLVNECPISWSSKKQPVVAMSTAESEYIALTFTVQNTLWLSNMLTELQGYSKSPIPIYEDNQACLKLTKESSNLRKVRHIQVRQNFVKHHVNVGSISVSYCQTERMIADILTKPLGKSLNEFFVKQLKLVPIPEMLNSCHLDLVSRGSVTRNESTSAKWYDKVVPLVAKIILRRLCTTNNTEKLLVRYKHI